MRILNDINEIDFKNVKLTSIIKKSTPLTEEYNKDTNTGFLIDEYFFYTLKNKVSNIASLFKRNLLTVDFYTEESCNIVGNNKDKISINCEVDYSYREEEELLLIKMFGKIYEFKELTLFCDDDKIITEIVTKRMNSDKFQVISVNNFIALVINLEDTKMIYIIQYHGSKISSIPAKEESLYIIGNDIKLKFDGYTTIDKFKDLISDLNKEREGYEKFNDVADTLFGRNILSFNSNIDNYNDIMENFAETINNRLIKQKIEMIIDNEYLFVPNNLLSKIASASYYTKKKFDDEIECDRKMKVRKAIRDALEYKYYCGIINPFTGIKLNSKNEQYTINNMTVVVTGRSYKNYFENCCDVWIPCDDEEKINDFKASLEILDKFENAE